MDNMEPLGIRGIYYKAKVKTFLTAAGFAFFGLCNLIIGNTITGFVAFGIIIFFTAPYYFQSIPFPFLVSGSFICPHCLKTIEVEKIQFSCPFCDTKYSNNAAALLNKCQNRSCQAKIKYITCYYCNNIIDLFTYYDEKKLRAKRYE